MEYLVSGRSSSSGQADFTVRESEVSFGIMGEEKELPNPAELLLGAFAACCLKNVERFSKILKFDYETAQIEVRAERQNVPSKITNIQYLILISSSPFEPQKTQKNTKGLHKRCFFIPFVKNFVSFCVFCGSKNSIWGIAVF